MSSAAKWKFILLPLISQLKKKKQKQTIQQQQQQNSHLFFFIIIFIFYKDSQPFLFQKERKAGFSLSVETASQIAPSKGPFPLQPALTCGFR